MPIVQWTNDEYHADTTRISSSGLKLIGKSPAHYYHKYLDPDRQPEKRTPALINGSAIHAYNLEFDLFFELFAVVPKDAPKKPTIIQIAADKKSEAATKSIKFWEKFYSDNANKTIIDFETFEICRNVKKALRNHPAASKILDGILAEQCVLFEEPNTGAPCKIKPDAINLNREMILDIKSCEDASDAGIVRSVLKYGYADSAAMYLDGFELGTGHSIKNFIFIFVEKQSPFGVQVKFMPEDMYSFGRQNYIRNAEVYMECLKTNTWNTYSNKITPLILPSYAINK